jgi:hypothetical protein
MPGFTENHVEEATLSWLEGLGYAGQHGPDISLDAGPRSGPATAM